MAKITPRTLSGFMELLPAPQQQMERIMEVLRKTYSLYGFTPLDTPVIESSEVLLAKAGGAGFDGVQGVADAGADGSCEQKHTQHHPLAIH